jgi:hypothetical protein
MGVKTEALTRSSGSAEVRPYATRPYSIDPGGLDIEWLAASFRMLTA